MIPGLQSDHTSTVTVVNVTLCTVMQVQRVETRHVYMNISQEGKDDIDDLRESYLIAAARVTSKDGQSITAYQLTEKGYDALARVPEDLCKEIDDFIDQQNSGR